MIKIKRNVKRSERRKLGIKRSSKARREHGLRNFAAKSDLLRKSPPCCEMVSQPRTSISQLRNLHALKSSISQPRLHFAGYFEAVKPLFGTRVPFGSPVHSFRSCEMAAKPQHLKILQRAHHELTCHSRTSISAIVGHISITSRSSNYSCNISF